MFGVEVPLLFSSSIYGIGFSLFVVGLAAFNLLLDFDFIEKAAASEAPKYMEWYGGFSLLVTLIWLYLEILRLLMKPSSHADRNDDWKPAGRLGTQVSVARSRTGFQPPARCAKETASARSTRHLPCPGARL